MTETIMTNKVNIIGGAIAAGLTAVFGQYWFLFAGLLLFNVIDWLTGWYLARIQKKESSKAGAKGIIKKIFYWIVIGTAFFVSIAFTEMGDRIGINLDFCIGIGWFVLASYLVNEIRSVLENAVELGVSVPHFLIKGLEVANEAIEKVTGDEDEHN